MKYTPKYDRAIDEAVAALASACLPGGDEIDAKRRAKRAAQCMLHAAALAGGKQGDNKILLEVQEAIIDRVMTRVSEKIVPSITAKLGADAARIVDEVVQEILRDALVKCHDAFKQKGQRYV